MKQELQRQLRSTTGAHSNGTSGWIRGRIRTISNQFKSLFSRSFVRGFEVRQQNEWGVFHLSVRSNSNGQHHQRGQASNEAGQSVGAGGACYGGYSFIYPDTF